MTVFEQVEQILISVLNLQSNALPLTDLTPLLGAIPEFDSMGVVSLITALEDRFGFIVEDDEIDASIFETVGTIVAFVKNKL